MASNTAELTVAVEEPRAWARRLTITVPADRVESERREVARRLSGRLNLPGFRAGKVPPQVVERRYGAAIQQEMLERLVEQAYREAIEQQGLQPITQGNVEDIDYAPGSDLTFHVELEVRPEIELDRLGGFEVAQPVVEVTDEEVDRVLERVREDNAAWQPIEAERPGAGDRVKVEMTPLTEGGKESEAKPRQYEIVLGEDQALPDVEQAIQTLEPGEENEFTIDVPSDEENAASEEHRVRVRLIEAFRPELPELDDALAQSIGDFETLDALRDRIRSDLETEAAQETERELRRELVERILEANPFEVPDAMVEQYLEQVLPDREGADPQRMAEARQAARPAAERSIRRMLIVERVAEQEGLRASADDVDARVEELAERHDRSPSEVWSQLQKSGQLQALEDEITEDRVFEYLKSLSTIT